MDCAFQFTRRHHKTISKEHDNDKESMMRTKYKMSRFPFVHLNPYSLAIVSLLNSREHDDFTRIMYSMVIVS